MTTVPPPSRTGLPGAAALLLVLLGVLVMHGVGGHGAGHGADPEAGHPHLDGIAPTVTVVGPPGVTADSPQPATDEAPSPPWTALCLAILVGAFLLTLTTGRGGRVRILPRRVAAAIRSPGRRDREPTRLVALSVCRC